MKRFVLIALALGLAQGCAHSVHQVYVSSMDSNRSYSDGKWITAESKTFVILGFLFDTLYVERAYRELEGQCSGRIAQVTSEHLTSYFFLSYDDKVVLKGLCLQKS